MSAEGPSAEKVVIPDILPAMPLKDVVLFPFVIVPLSVSREKSIAAVDAALAEQRVLLLVAQKDSSVEEPKPEDLYTIGTAAAVMRMLKLPDEKVRVLVQGIARARVQNWDEGLPYMQARIQVLEEGAREISGVQLEALMRNVSASLEKASSMGKNISQEVMIIAANLDDPGRLADLVASNLSLKLEEAQEILSILDPSMRLRRIHELLAREIELLTVQQQINTQAKDEIDKGQREFFLRQQLKAIQGELGEGDAQNAEPGGEAAAFARHGVSRCYAGCYAAGGERRLTGIKGPPGGVIGRAACRAPC